MNCGWVHKRWLPFIVHYSITYYSQDVEIVQALQQHMTKERCPMPDMGMLLDYPWLLQKALLSMWCNSFQVCVFVCVLCKIIKYFPVVFFLIPLLSLISPSSFSLGIILPLPAGVLPFFTLHTSYTCVLLFSFLDLLLPWLPRSFSASLDFAITLCYKQIKRFEARIH